MPGAQAPAEQPEPGQEVEYEEVCTDYIHYTDFGHNVCRTWAEVCQVWKKVYLTREELEARGFRDWEKIPLDHTPEVKKGSDGAKGGDKATIYEVWDKSARKVYWLHKDVPFLLDEVEDPLRLKGFFPCPRPLYATLNNDSLVPTPDYVEYRDQAAELDELTAKIASLTKALKVAGVYDASYPALSNLLSEGIENRLIPIENWQWANTGDTLENHINWMPLEQVIKGLQAMYEARQQVKNDLYEITGIADIVRGDSDPDETATAQSIKGQYANMRLEAQQQETARFLRDAIEIMAEIVAGHFSAETLGMITGVELFTEMQKTQLRLELQAAHPPQAGAPARPLQPALPPDVKERMDDPSWEQVMALLQNRAALHFRISIETDSTIKADQEADKAARIEFLKTVGGLVQQASAAPVQIMPLLGEIMMYAVRGFKSARSVEGALEEFVAQMEQNPPQPPPAPPNPALQIAQLKAQADVQSTQAKMEKARLESQQKAQSDALWRQSEQQIAQMKLEYERQIEQMKAQIEVIKSQLESRHDLNKAMAVEAIRQRGGVGPVKPEAQ